VIPPDTIYIATGNAHKVQEISEILGDSIHCVSMKTLEDVPTLIEDQDTFEGNALAKATQMASWLARRGLASGHWMTLADDSGLEVDALDGQPGVRSARFAADDSGVDGNASDAANNTKLMGLMKDVPDASRTARFRCVLALVQPAADGSPEKHWTFDGACEGVLQHSLSGDQGFGYDPLFRPVGYDQTFATLGAAIKNDISHRSHALRKLQSLLQS